MNDELKAGRELDALIAEKVFGISPITWRRYANTADDDFDVSELRGPWRDVPVKIVECEQTDEGAAPFGTDWIEHYRTDIAAAMKVFFWLADRGIVRLSNGDGDSKDCDFIPTKISGLKTSHVSSSKWGMAICLAALRACGAIPTDSNSEQPK